MQKNSIKVPFIVYADFESLIEPINGGEPKNGKRFTNKYQKHKKTQKNFKDKINLISKKGVYPYEYMDKIEKLDEIKLPPKEAFYSKLNNSHISDKDYKHANKVWKEFNMKTMGDYHDLYLKSDVLLLADVFEEFRRVCLENYDLDPAGITQLLD